MTDAANHPNPGFWDSDLLDVLLSPLQQQTPHPAQDTKLLQQFGLLPGLKELLMLRQVHALEHATVWVLSESLPGSNSLASPDNETLSGMSTDRGFYLYGQVSREELQRAVQRALRRITGGEWNLAVHPRCGTNLSVSMLLTAGLALGTSVFFPRGPIEQMLGLGLAATAAAHLAPDLGSMAQQYVTTAIPFNLRVVNITVTKDYLGRSAYFVQTSWVD